ncbi:hypothetical protein PAPYR_8991 [Paratrimastix pyriformis]|uniref:Uncharacterized protein n=1 Tax=Paratrimastix pyriformis TaxID=342808 RepID=A0ABQ8U9H2_9EUKA|nr:hypothetical protein PAPYR_8991 [Paratrimastix pyriformis]
MSSSSEATGGSISLGSDPASTAPCVGCPKCPVCEQDLMNPVMLQAKDELAQTQRFLEEARQQIARSEETNAQLRQEMAALKASAPAEEEQAHPAAAEEEEAKRGPEVSQLLEEARTQIDGMLTLYDRDLADRHAVALAEWLAIHKCYKLYLAGNPISIEGVRILAAALPGSTLEKLDLDSLCLGDEGTRLIAAALPMMSCLKDLHLDQNQIGDELARILAATLPQCATLSELHLADNLIGDEGARAFAAALSQNSTLRVLDIAGAHSKMSADGVRALIAVLDTNSTIWTVRRPPCPDQGNASVSHKYTA